MCTTYSQIGAREEAIKDRMGGWGNEEQRDGLRRSLESDT